jgi:Fic family protein
LPPEFLDGIINEVNNFLVEKFGTRQAGSFMSQDPHMDARIARRLQQKKQQLDRYRPLEPFTVQRLHQELRLLATYHSTAIEGNTLSLRETQMVLEYGITVDGHPLREYLEATNHAEAFDTLLKLVERPITVATVETLHRLVMAKIDPHAGEVRTVSVFIRGAPFTPPPARDVPLYLAQWVRWLTSDAALRYDPLTRAAIAHHDFEALHPFTDGNGRVGRLLLNLMLMQDGSPPALVLSTWRARYIQALQQAYVGEYSSLVDLVGLAVEQALDLYLEACVESTAHLLPMQELAPLFNTTVDYLGQLARAGKFEARKQGQYWYASKEAVQQYFQEADAQPRGRPRKKQP